MKACADHSGILSPKNAPPRRLTSDELDVVSIPKAAEVWQFVTFLRRTYGTMLWWKGKTAPSHVTSLRLASDQWLTEDHTDESV